MKRTKLVVIIKIDGAKVSTVNKSIIFRDEVNPVGEVHELTSNELGTAKGDAGGLAVVDDVGVEVAGKFRTVEGSGCTLTGRFAPERASNWAIAG